MGEELLVKIFSEQGLVYLMFFILFISILWKGVPALVKIFENQQERFKEALDNQQSLYKESLEKISTTFLEQIEKSNSWHDKHSSQLDEVKNVLSKIVDYIGKK